MSHASRRQWRLFLLVLWAALATVHVEADAAADNYQ
jgi:hypothetical protein